MGPETARIEFLLARDGPAKTRAWVQRTLQIYRDALANPTSHAATPEFRRSFERSVAEFERWLAAD